MNPFQQQLADILNREYHCGHCGWDMQLSDATVNEIRSAVLQLIESDLIGENFDISKFPFGNAQIQGVVANHIKDDMRAKLRSKS